MIEIIFSLQDFQGARGLVRVRTRQSFPTKAAQFELKQRFRED